MFILVQKETISEELGVSLATVNNWIKTRVIPSPDVQNCYSKNTFNHIINTIKSNQTRLSSGANRTLLAKKTLCCLGVTNKDRKKILSNLVNDFENSNFSIDEGVLAVSFAMLRSNKLIDENWQPNTNSKFDAMLSQWAVKTPHLETVKNFFGKYEILNLDDDILGAFYQSVQSVSQKSGSGSYYTPSELLSEIKIPPRKTVLDPCCGSGGILLNILTKAHDPSKIFARDIDETALKICYINLVLFFNNRDIMPNISKQDITLNTTGDLFFRSNGGLFDYIVTNPPWGSKFTVRQKETLGKLYPELATSEIFSISLYNAVKMLKKNGELYFFLPHSFLNVAAHKRIRQYVFNTSNRISIKLLGNAFKGVLSESILLHLKSNSIEKQISVQNKNGNVYQIPLKNISPPDFIVSATGKTQDTLLIEKMYNTAHTTLTNGAIFALGIVTGNNKKYLTEEKTTASEAIFRGKDIDKYAFRKPKYYLEFKPELYQQTAPEEYYRQEKIAYRFISDKLVCVLDKGNSLLLNSANLFISKSYPMETIVSFFNSDIYTFIFRKKFHSRKVLKSHLQNLPLPILPDETHQFIYNLYNGTFYKKNGNIALFQEKIDKIICSAFSINEEQFNYIKGEI
ncbi:MAG: N-6 DNA methylase [Spirochaetaceae bacterium]|jgi:type I restriction-modification system DNA methylase subunit|nr:N-6 DNA methylase [Spirochaetaceae bacterium]